MRHYDKMCDSSWVDDSKSSDGKSGLFIKTLFVLSEIEWNGQATSINIHKLNGKIASDGGTWFFHMQPDTAHQRWLKVYSDKAWSFSEMVYFSNTVWDTNIKMIKGKRCNHNNVPIPRNRIIWYITKDKKITWLKLKTEFTGKNYADFNYWVLIKKGYTHRQAYYIHGQWLIQLKKESEKLPLNKRYSFLAWRDDRMDVHKNIKWSMNYLHSARKSIKDRLRYVGKKITEKEDQIYSVNAFNKWRWWEKGRNPAFTKMDPHVTNFKSYAAMYDKYMWQMNKAIAANPNDPKKAIDLLIKNNVNGSSIIKDKESINKVQTTVSKIVLSKWATTSKTNNIKIQEQKQIIEDAKFIKKIDSMAWAGIWKAKILDQVTTKISKDYENYSKDFVVRILSPWWDTDLIVISPRNNRKITYSIGISYSNKVRSLKTESTKFKLKQWASYDINKVVWLIVSIIIKSLAYSPDTDKEDIMKWIFKLSWWSIEFNQRRPWNENVASQEDFKWLISMFPWKESIVTEKIVSMMNDMYRQAYKQQQNNK